jgi:RNA polymerase sigma factor (TIGR02999 family)
MDEDAPEDMAEIVGSETTRLLRQWSEGDQEAFVRLKEHVHTELRRLASWYLSGERPGHILQATLIVHDVYIQLLQLNKAPDKRNMIPWSNRSHFIGVVAHMMRHIIVVRETKAKKRGGGLPNEPIGETDAAVDPALDEVIAVHQAMDRLERVNPRWKAVVELYYFGGLNFEEVGETLNISKSSAKRDYDAAKEWLYQELGGGRALER